MAAPSSGSSETSADSAATRMALQYIRENPWQAAQTVVKKVLLLMSSDGELAVGNFSDAAATSGLRFREKVPERANLSPSPGQSAICPAANSRNVRALNPRTRPVRDCLLLIARCNTRLSDRILWWKPIPVPIDAVSCGIRGGSHSSGPPQNSEIEGVALGPPTDGLLGLCTGLGI